MHHRPRAGDNVEIGEGVAVVANENAGATALPARAEHGDDGRLDFFDHRHALGLSFEHGVGNLLGLERQHEGQGDAGK